MYVDGAVVKIASRCNLNCTYCYIYNKGDDTFLQQSKFMSNETINQFALKVESYVNKYSKKNFIIVFHGGEPMLAGKERIRYFVETMKKINSKVDLHFAIQTNGVLIDESWAEFFEELKINVGVSLDGTKESNDTFRVYKNGKSSYDEIIRGIKTMREHNKERLGILTVMDINQDPIEVYNHYKSLGLEYVNLLYPDDTHDDNFVDDLKLGKWLASIYDEWNADESDNGVEIEQFIKLNSLMLGMPVNDEYYGQGRPNTFILETNGELQANDPIRVCKNGMSKTPLNIHDNEIHELFELPISFLYYNNHKLLSEKCNNCQLKDICGGGYVLNRYSKINGFDNPTIYCKSIAYFICHVQNVLIKTLDKDFVDEKDVEPLLYEDVLPYIESSNNTENLFLQSFK